jgi:hypothetical protein
MAKDISRKAVSGAPLSVTDEELLRKARERQARADAKRAETEARAAEAERIREARRAANQPLRTHDEKVASFRRLAKQRVARAVKALDAVGNLSARGSYAYTDEQVANIMAHLSGAFSRLEARFTKGSTEAESFEI